jgi:protein gp37
MADRTEISWTDSTWNAVTGCSKVSEGCRNCYAAKLAPRLAAMGQKGYTRLPWTKKNAPENVFLHEDRLEKPLRWKKPRRIFVNSMSDLFHEQVPDEFIDKVFAVMGMAGERADPRDLDEALPAHTFQILTKRPERMAAYLNDWDRQHRIIEAIESLGYDGEQMDLWHSQGWPLKNVWLGTSVEDQKAADERVPHLLETPAAVRFLSCEPLIGPVELMKFYPATDGRGWESVALTSTLAGGQKLHLIDWVIAGGESGPGYRPMDPAWPRSLRDQCIAAGVSFFYKQDSGPRNEMNPYLDGEMWRQFPQTTAVKS